MSDFRPGMVAAQRGTHVIARAYGTIGDESAPRLRQQPRGLTDDSTPTEEGGIVASTTVPDNTHHVSGMADDDGQKCSKCGQVGYFDVRAQCSKCGRFVAERDIRVVNLRPAAGFYGEVDDGHDSHPKCGMGVPIDLAYRWLHRRRGHRIPDELEP